MSDGFDGIEQLISDIGDLNRNVIEEIALPALLETAEEAVMAARAGVDVRSGRLKRSIHVGGHPELSGGEFDPARDKGMYKDLGKGEMSNKRAEVFVGSTLFYAYWEEFGGPKNSANPAIRRGVESVMPRLEGRLSAAMEEAARRRNL